MIFRYTLPEMQKQWSDTNRFQTWFNVELAVLKVLAKKKVIPSKSISYIEQKAKIKVDRILEIEKEVKHDVIAFSTSIAEQCGEHGRYFHYGLTSSDVVDTALAILVRDSLILIQESLEDYLKALLSLSNKTKKIPSMGRTHGMFAEPTVFGLRFLGAYAEGLRQYKALTDIIESISYGKLSGAVGVYGALSPDVEKVALKNLGLKVEPVSTQILPRDRMAQVLSWIAQMGASIERLAVELRHLQRSEVSEVEEEFSVGQKGSSAMPHKKNPISSENMTGCARVLRGYAVTAFENVALWHERDISHSSAERIILPDATTLLHYMLKRMTGVVKNLGVKKERIQSNLDSAHGVFFSGHVLLALVKKGMTREDGYKVVQSSAHKAIAEEKHLMDVLWKQEAIRKNFTQTELKKIFDIKHLLRHSDDIYERVYAEGARILKNEEAQGTVEYVIFLVVIIGAVLFVGRSVSEQIRSYFIDRIAGNFRRNLFRAENMYRFPLR